MAGTCERCSRLSIRRVKQLGTTRLVRIDTISRHATLTLAHCTCIFNIAQAATALDCCQNTDRHSRIFMSCACYRMPHVSHLIRRLQLQAETAVA